MNHLNEEEMILKHYNELRDAALEAHLADCAECRAELQRLSAALARVPQIKVPELPDSYEAKVWANLRDQLPERRQGWFAEMLRPRQWAVAGAMAALVVVAFVAGRYVERGGGNNAGQNPVTISDAGRDRIVSVSLDHHLERTQILLVEVLTSDSKGKGDFTDKQETARDLLDSNRLYRTSNTKTAKDPAVQHTLDELERVLVEIANSPQDVSRDDIDRLQRSIEQQGLLFKVRVIDSKLKEQNKQAITRSNGNRT
jgi:hypothetical protein